MPKKSYSYYDDFYYESRGPIEAEGGVKARSQRGEFAKNWWATRWIAAMERLMDTGRLRRGRSYARKGQVLSIEEIKGGVKARVQGSRRTPYRVTIQIEPLTDAQWEKVTDALSEQALFTARLLAGEMPEDIEQAFQAAGVSLFPERRGDLSTDCSCPDWANPCKHVAATHYILGDRFDEDPFLIFRLRGRSQDQILQDLRKRRAGQEAFDSEGEDEEAEPVLPLEETLAHYWECGESLENFSVSMKPPEVEMPLLKRLGEPTFLSDAGQPGRGIEDLLRPAYQSITQAALDAAFQEDEMGEESQ